jgi:hypothetical protein
MRLVYAVAVIVLIVVAVALAVYLAGWWTI